MSLYMLGAVAVRDTRPMDAYANTVENEFLAMKKLADDAKWPSDLTPKITSIDKAWQDAKASANAAKITVARAVGPDSALRKSIQEMSATLRARLANPGGDGKGSWWTRKVLGEIPGYGVVAGGTVALVTLGLIVRKVWG